MDHFDSHLNGCTFSSRSGITADQCVRVYILVDSMISYIHVEYQLVFSSSETLRAKQSYDRLTSDHDVIVNSYKADNGVFEANAFITHIWGESKLSLCGVILIIKMVLLSEHLRQCRNVPEL